MVEMSSASTHGKAQFATAILVFGILQFICGIALIISDTLYVITHTPEEVFAHTAWASGIWIGAFYFATGCLCIFSVPACSHKPMLKTLRCLLPISFTCSVISAVAALGLITQFAVAISAGKDITVIQRPPTTTTTSSPWNSGGYSQTFDEEIYRGPESASLSFHVMMAVFSIVQAALVGVSYVRLPYNGPEEGLGNQLGPIAQPSQYFAPLTGQGVYGPSVAHSGQQFSHPPGQGFYGQPVLQSGAYFASPGQQGVYGQPVHFEQLPNHPGYGHAPPTYRTA